MCSCFMPFLNTQEWEVFKCTKKKVVQADFATRDKLSLMSNAGCGIFYRQPICITRAFFAEDCAAMHDFNLI